MRIALPFPRLRSAGRETAPAAPDAIRVYRHHAARAIAEERWAAALVFLDRILEVEPRNTEAWLTKGHLHLYGRGDEPAAIACYRKVIVLGGYDATDPHVAKARSSLERLLKRLA